MNTPRSDSFSLNQEVVLVSLMNEDKTVIYSDKSMQCSGISNRALEVVSTSRSQIAQEEVIYDVDLFIIYSKFNRCKRNNKKIKLPAWVVFQCPRTPVPSCPWYSNTNSPSQSWPPSTSTVINDSDIDHEVDLCEAPTPHPLRFLLSTLGSFRQPGSTCGTSWHSDFGRLGVGTPSGLSG